MGLAVDESKKALAPWVAVLGAGAAVMAFALAVARFRDPKSSLLAYALGILSYAFGGMFGVFLAAIFTRRGNTASVIAALLTGAIVTGLLAHSGQVPNMWWLPIAAAASFGVCVLPRGTE
jgi:Na+/proline symporter